MTPRRPILTQVHLMERRAEQYRMLSTEALLAAHAGDWVRAAAVIDEEEGRELRVARAAAERHGIRQFYAWVRQAQTVRH